MGTHKITQPQINLGDQSIYIAGPMKGHEHNNEDAFAEAAHKFKEQGFEVFNPLELSSSLSSFLDVPLEELSFREIVCNDIITIVEACTHMYMLNGWQYSEGAKVEHALAQWLGMTILYQDSESLKEAQHYDKEWWFSFQAEQFRNISELTRKKNNDYTGGAYTSNPFANFDEAESFGVDPLVGLAVRMGDKMQRLRAFCNKGLSLETEGDTVADIFRDLIGYSTIALGMLERDKTKD